VADDDQPQTEPKPRGRTFGPNAPHAAARAARCAAALELRRKRWSFDQIGAELGVTAGAAFRYFREEMARLASVTHETATELRQLETATLDEAEKALLERIRNPAVDRFGEVEPVSGHVAALVRVQERRAKLLGLDAPTKLEHSGPDGGPIQVAAVDLSRLSDGELQALRDLVAKALPPGPTSQAEDAHDDDDGEAEP
jgi:AcrR family transcriptional regulator